MSAKRSKLDEQFHKDQQTVESQIFAGVSIYVNGYTSEYFGCLFIFQEKTYLTHVTGEMAILSGNFS